MAQLRDPSDSIEGKLIPHIHLISANQYPSVARLDLQHVTKLLMAAPQIAKDKAPFFWTYLQLPNPGSVILTWQPISKMGVHFASDGFIWMPEQYHRQDLGNGLSIEIYYSRAGFRPGEPIASFARRRFRLVPSQQGNPNVPQIDMNLWIIHYAQSEPADQCESRSIPYTPEIQNMMTERNILQSYGAIERKEFMLSDRGKWPRIPWPGHGGPRGPPGPGPGQGQVPMPGPGPSAAAAAAAAAAAGGQYGPVQGRRPIPQQMAYPPAPPPSSRSRRAMPQQPPQAQAQPPAVPEFIDQEEQDVFDILTPRDLALARYRQNHEWMEEVISSPYSFHQLEPPELGLGLRGQMGSLTDGIFNAPGGDALNAYPEKPYVGRLDSGQAEAFRKRAQEYIDSEKAEIEKMKAEHAKMMASLKSGSSVRQAEKELRLSVEERGPEFWRLEGRTAEGEEGGSAWSQKHNKKVDDIVAQVEAQLGHRIAALNEVSRIQDGGYREPAPKPVKQPTPPAPVQPPQPAAAVAASGGDDLSRRPSQAGSQNSGVMVDDNDIDMGGTAAGLLDQMHTGFSAGSTPLNFPTPGGLNSNAGTPANMNVPSPAPNPPSNPQEEKKEEEAPQDVAMGGTEADKSGTGDKGEDWVVVPKGGVSPDGAATPADAAGQAAKPAQAQAHAAAPKPVSAAGTPAVTEGDANDFSSLGDLDTAGDALAEFGTPGGLDGAAGSLGEGLDLNMDMEDSAFGDAFHGVGQGGTPGGQSEGS